MKTQWFSTIPVVFALTLAISLGFIEFQKGAQVFSTESLEALRVLNGKNGMTVDDLSSLGNDSPFVSELLRADVLMAEPEVNRENTGLVVTLNTDSSKNMLLLQPVKPLSDVELATLAQQYEKAIPEFEHVEVDQELELFSPYYNWPITEPLGAPPTLPQYPSLSRTEVKTIRVAVIDSGVDATHEIFAEDPVLTGWNTISGNTTMVDDVGHGTHIAGIIASESENIEIIPYKIVDSQGGKLSNVVEALSLALDNDVDVINMSFGVSSPSYALEALVEKAYEENVILVAAAGNNGTDHGFYPAEYEHTVAVASVDSDGSKMPNSNYGDWIDIAAYGYHIRSSLPDNAYGYKSGTSQATAKVTAAVVALLESASSNSEWTLKQVLSALQAEGEVISDGELAGVTRIQ